MKKINVFKLAMALFVILGLLITSGAVAAEKAKKAPETIQGMCEQGDKGTPVIKTTDGQTFMVLGQNLTSMIGKTVKVTGTLSKGKATRSIMVTHFAEVKFAAIENISIALNQLPKQCRSPPRPATSPL